MAKRRLEASQWDGDPDRRVLAYSRFGHGRSDLPPAPRTPAFFACEACDVLPEVLRQLDAERSILVGGSDGASIALIHAAARSPTGLVLIAPHVFVEPVTLAGIRATRDAYLEHGLRDRLARHHDDVDAAFFGWCDVWLDPEFERWNLSADVARVRAPTLLIQGIHDQYARLAQLDRIQAGAPAPIHRVELEAKHSPHLEAPEETVAAIATFTAALD